MLYSIVGIDKPNSLEARMAVRSEHVERLNAPASEQGKLGYCRP